MKQKRTYVTLLLIVALLVLGVAYALFDGDSLTINGTATASVASGEVDVVFIDAKPAEGSNTGTTAEITEGKEDEAEFTVVGLKTVGDTQTVTFKVENQTEGGVPVTLAEPSVTIGNTEWYEVTTCAFDKTTLDANGAADDADSATLTVTVRLKKTVSTADSETAANQNNTITITLNASAATN